MTEFYGQYSQSRRLHPLSMLYRSIVSLPQMAIVFYFAVFQHSMENWIYLILAALFAFIAFPSIFLTYYYFTFYLTNKELVIHSGVLSRKQRNIPLERIQNIEINQNFLQRILGLAKVSAETAGDSATEGKLEFVSKQDAEEIRQVIKVFQKRLKEDEEGSKVETDAVVDPDIDGDELVEEEQEVRKLFSMSLKDNFVHGMLRFRPVVLIFIAWAYSLAQQFFITPDSDEIGSFFEANAQYFTELSTFSIILFVIAGVLSILLLSWIADIFLTVAKFYGFKLYFEEDKLQTEHGLFSRRKGTIPLKKLQMLVVQTNPIRKKLGFAGLNLETAGLGTKGKTSELAVPFAKFDRIVTLAQDIRNFAMPYEFRPISRKAIRRALVRYFVGLIPLAIAMYFILPGLMWGFLLAPLLYFAALIRWRFRGYEINEEMVFIRQGFWVQRISVIPIEKVQTINVVQTFFQRRLGLASVYIDTAAKGHGNDAGISDIDLDDAITIRDEVAAAFHERSKETDYQPF